MWSLGLNHDKTICESLNIRAAGASLVQGGPELVAARGQAKFLCVKSSVNQKVLAGTNVGKWTAVVKIAEICQTEYP